MLPTLLFVKQPCTEKDESLAYGWNGYKRLMGVVVLHLLAPVAILGVCRAIDHL